MADPWPASLPCLPLRGSFARKLGDNVLRSQTDTGPGKQRARASSAGQPVSQRMRMTAEQVQTLIAFHELTLRWGSLPFTAQVLGEEVDQLLRFSDPPEWQEAAPGKYDVTLSLVIMP